MGNEQGREQGVPTPAGIQSMDESLQKKFSKGIQYNMKIVIRGDRNTGKTTLFHRMEGKAFSEAYSPTNEIQVTSILWSYQVTNDTVKVEIWDVVDKGKSQRRSSNAKGLLKMFNSGGNDGDDEDDESGQTLDASFLDVYKGAHGVVFCFDITKQWTWKYIERQLSEVPLHIPVIILANFCDMNEHRLISREHCIAMIESFGRPDGAADVRYAECSLKNGFGLMHLHKFLSIPFLQLQQETLLQRLQTNREQRLAAMEELDEAVHTDDQNYNMYLVKLQRIAESKKRKVAGRQDSTGNESPAQEGSNTPPQPRLPAAVDKAPPPPTEPRAQPQSQRSGSIANKLSSRISGFLGKGKEDTKTEEARSNVPSSKPKVTSTTNIEEFVPEGGAVDDFLADDDEEDDDDDDDEEVGENSESDEGNPMIAGDEDLSTPETTPLPSSKNFKTNAKKFTLDDDDSDSDEEQEDSSIIIPINAHQSKPTPKPLKSALDVELTESSEDEEAHVVMADSDFDGEEKNPPPSSSSAASALPIKNQTQKSKRSNPSLDIFEPMPPAGDKTKKKKSTGLMLQFDSLSSSPQAAPKKTKSVTLDPEESPDGGRKERKKKKSKKKRSSKDEGEIVAIGNGTAKDQGSSNGAAVETTADDPFGAIASLDAWLNSDSGDVSKFLTPTKTSEVGEEVGKKEVNEDGEEEEEEEKPKKSKKHKHKSRSDGGGEEGGGGGSSRKKKHKSHHHKSSSRHKNLDQEEYQNI